MGKLTLIIGGSNSGKSKFAEDLAKKHKDVLYLATAEVLDEEMKKKVQRHRQSRPDEWITIEEPVNIDQVIKRESDKFSAILVECILLFVNNIMQKSSNLPDDEIESIAFNKTFNTIEIIKNSKVDCYFISGETGLGLIAENKSARLFCRILGVVNQLLAENAAEVYFVVAGIPMRIK